MFSNSNSKETRREVEATVNSNNTIAQGTVIKGDLETTGNIRIEGRIEGNVKSRAKVFVGDSGQIQGNIFSQNAEVEGKIDGNIEISERLTLKASSVIKGDIRANKLVVEDGATWHGNCNVGTAVKSTDQASANGRAKEPVNAGQARKQPA